MATGDIGSVIDTLTYATSAVEYPSVCKANGNVFAVAYYRSSKTYLRTFLVSDTSITALSSAYTVLEDGYIPDIIQIAKGKIAIVFGTLEAVRKTYVRTYSIGTNGDISLIDTLLIHEGTAGNIYSCGFPSIYKIGDNGIYAVLSDTNPAYNPAKLITFSITKTGHISNSVLDIVDIGTKVGYYPRMAHVVGSVWAIAYQDIDISSKGYLVTLTISDSSGAIGSVIDTYKFRDEYTSDIDVIQASETSVSAILLISSKGSTTVGKVQTVLISNAGIITPSVISSKTLTNNASSPTAAMRMKMIADGVFVIGLFDTDIELSTYPVDSGGSIGDSIDSVTLASSPSTASNLEVSWKDSVYFVAGFEAGSANGMLSLVDIENELGEEGEEEEEYPAVYPTSDLTRVSTIRHIYRPGFFRMQVTLGDIQSAVQLGGEAGEGGEGGVAPGTGWADFWRVKYEMAHPPRFLRPLYTPFQKVLPEFKTPFPDRTVEEVISQPTPVTKKEPIRAVFAEKMLEWLTNPIETIIKTWKDIFR